MKKLILDYGAISGLVIIVVNTLSIELGMAHVWLGFLVMFIAFILRNSTTRAAGWSTTSG